MTFNSIFLRQIFKENYNGTHESRENMVGIVTNLLAGRYGIWIPADRLGGPSSFLFNWYRGSLLCVQRRHVNLII